MEAVGAGVGAVGALGFGMGAQVPVHILTPNNLALLLPALFLALVPVLMPTADRGACWGRRPLDALLTVLVFIPVGRCKLTLSNPR
jgi:hypothetical protein